MSEVVLERPGVAPIVGELVACGVSEHVRMHREWQRAGLADPRQCLTDAGLSHRCLTLGLEDMAPIRLFPPQPAQRTKLFASERMDRRHAALQPGDMQQALREI